MILWNEWQALAREPSIPIIHMSFEKHRRLYFWMFVQIVWNIAKCVQLGHTIILHFFLLIGDRAIRNRVLI